MEQTNEGNTHRDAKLLRCNKTQDYAAPFLPVIATFTNLRWKEGAANLYGDGSCFIEIAIA